MRNHLGQYECRLCLTLHNNEGNYLAHTQVHLHAIFCTEQQYIPHHTLCLHATLLLLSVAEAIAGQQMAGGQLWCCSGSTKSLPVQRRLQDQHYLAKRTAREDPPTNHSMPAMLKTACHLLQGKRHQQNLAKRAAWEAQDKPTAPAPQKRAAVSKTVKIGRPGYRVTKQFASDTKQRSLLFQVGYFRQLGADLVAVNSGSAGNRCALLNVTSDTTAAASQVEYPEIEEGSQPRHRFMSSFEQRKEATDRKYQVRIPHP